MIACNSCSSSNSISTNKNKVFAARLRLKRCTAQWIRLATYCGVHLFMLILPKLCCRVIIGYDGLISLIFNRVLFVGSKLILIVIVNLTLDKHCNLISITSLIIIFTSTIAAINVYLLLKRSSSGIFTVRDYRCTLPPLFTNGRNVKFK